MGNKQNVADNHGSNERRILFAGLDRAGKTCLHYVLEYGEFLQEVQPTIVPNIATVYHKRLNFNITDIGGSVKARPAWRHFYEHKHCVVFVVDSADHARLGDYQQMKDAQQTILGAMTLLVEGFLTRECSRKQDEVEIATAIVELCVNFCNDGTRLIDLSACQELHIMLQHEALVDAALLVLANKQDLDNAMSAEQISQRLGLPHIENRTTGVIECSALKKQGLKQITNWFETNLQQK